MVQLCESILCIKHSSVHLYWTVPRIRRLHSSSSSSVRSMSLSLVCLKSGRKKRGEDCKAGSASRRPRQLLFLHSGKSSRESNLPVCYCIQTTLFHTHAFLFPPFFSVSILVSLVPRVPPRSSRRIFLAGRRKIPVKWFFLKWILYLRFIYLFETKLLNIDFKNRILQRSFKFIKRIVL